jgi:hypothetical protein
MFKNRVLRKMCGPKMNEVKQYVRKQHNEALHDLYSAPNIIWVIKLRIMRNARHVARVEERGGADSVLMGNPNGKRSFGRPTRRWEDNIKTHPD